MSKTKLTKDQQLIEGLGGVKAVAEYLGCNYSTVHNWLVRGIPSKVKVDNPDIFMVKTLDDIQPLTAEV